MNPSNYNRNCIQDFQPSKIRNLLPATDSGTRLWAVLPPTAIFGYITENIGQSMSGLNYSRASLYSETEVH